MATAPTQDCPGFTRYRVTPHLRMTNHAFPKDTLVKSIVVFDNVTARLDDGPNESRLRWLPT